MKKLISVLLIAVLAFSCLNITVFAKNETVTSCINLVNVSKNERGPGWDWANRYDILTLNNLTVETSDDYGLRLPADATVVLEGDNYIKASKAAVVFAGNTTFKGEGTLTLVSDDMGFFVNCSNERKNVYIVGGTYKIEAANYGIKSEKVPFSIADCTMDINVKNADGAAAYCYSLAINGAKVNANNSFDALYGNIITDADIKTESSRAVFTSSLSSVVFNKETIEGNDKATAEEFAAKTSIDMKGNAPHYTQSVLFGAGVHIWVDYVVIAAVVLVIGSTIFIKLYRQKKRDEAKKAEIARIKANGGNLADMDD